MAKPHATVGIKMTLIKLGAGILIILLSPCKNISGYFLCENYRIILEKSLTHFLTSAI